MASVTGPRSRQCFVVMRIGRLVPVFPGFEVLPFSCLGIPLIISQDIVFSTVPVTAYHIALFEFSADGIDSVFQRKIRIVGKFAKVPDDHFRIFSNLADHFGMSGVAPVTVFVLMAFFALFRTDIVCLFLCRYLQIRLRTDMLPAQLAIEGKYFPSFDISDIGCSCQRGSEQKQ